MGIQKTMDAPFQRKSFKQKKASRGREMCGRLSVYCLKTRLNMPFRQSFINPLQKNQRGVPWFPPCVSDAADKDTSMHTRAKRARLFVCVYGGFFVVCFWSFFEKEKEREFLKNKQKKEKERVGRAFIFFPRCLVREEEKPSTYSCDQNSYDDDAKESGATSDDSATGVKSSAP